MTNFKTTCEAQLDELRDDPRFGAQVKAEYKRRGQAAKDWASGKTALPVIGKPGVYRTINGAA